MNTFKFSDKLYNELTSWRRKGKNDHDILTKIFGEERVNKAHKLKSLRPQIGPSYIKVKNKPMRQIVDDERRWIDIGVIGDIEVTMDDLNKCLVSENMRPPLDFTQELLKYRLSIVIDQMFDKMIERNLMKISEETPNMGVYYKIKASGKMQAISDHLVCNKYEDSVKRRFSLTTPDDIKKILHENGDTFFYVFDILNFFHSFRPTDEVREKIKTIY
jgi:hypothetical protein